MTVCRPLTARIEDRTYFSSFFIKIFELPRVIFTEDIIIIIIIG